MIENRRSVRTKLRSRIRISHESIGVIETVTRDISDTGVFLLLDSIALPQIGTVIKGQVMDLPGGDAPMVDMEVVRYDEDGIGVRFVH